MTGGHAPSTDDWNRAFLPNVVLSGSIGASDLAAGIITSTHLGVGVFSGLTAATALAAGDKLPYWQAAAADNRIITVANALNGVFSLAPAGTAFTAYSTDLLTSYNGTAAVSMSVARFAQQLLAQAPALTATDDADTVLVHDASAADGSRAVGVTLANLLPNKGTAGTFAFPTSVVVDAKGRVTSVTAGSGGVASVFKASGSLPTGYGYTNGTPVTVSPSFSAAPSTVDLSFECTSTDGDWAVGDRIPATAVVNQTNSHQTFVPVWTTADTIKVVLLNGTPLLRTKDGSTIATFTPSKWKFNLVAVKYS